MTTATLPKPTATKATPLPPCPGLTIEIDCELDSKTQKLIDTYRTDVCNFSRAVTDLHNSRSRLLEGALETPLKTTLSGAEKLTETRAALQRRLAELRWRRFELLPLLVPSFRAAVSRADAELDQTIAAVRKDFETIGVTVVSIQNPATGQCLAHANPEAAENLLMQKIRQHEAVMSAQGAANLAAVALRVLYSQIHPPAATTCTIGWQSAPAGVQSEVAAMAKLSSADVCQTPPPLDGQRLKIARQCGLAGTAILKEHIEVIDEILVALPESTFYSPMDHIRGKQLETVRALLAKLPQTQEIKNFLRDTADGTPRAVAKF